MKVPGWIQRWLFRRKADDCFRIAMRICLIGFDNGDAQKHLSRAKDELYTASRIFRENSETLL